MRSLFFPQRSTEATIEQLVATGAAGGFGMDPIDQDSGFRPAGSHSTRDMPVWTLDKARAYSVAAYRLNPLARAILDTYSSFCVGDRGVSVNCTNPEVLAWVMAFWKDPKVGFDKAGMHELMLRQHLIMGETIDEMMVGRATGVVRFSPIDPSQVTRVDLEAGNPLWPATLHVRNPDGEPDMLDVIRVNDVSGLREGEVFFEPSFKTLLTDRRGYPFLGPILDQLDDYDAVISNLVDRTALMRYMALDVTIQGSQDDVDAFVKKRNGLHVPASGSIEVHNQAVEWKPMQAQVGAQEDTTTAGAILTQVAGGVGLAKTWLAEPEGANRATSLTMAEPVRRRVGGVQNVWLSIMTEKLRFVVDQAVAAGRIPEMVPSTDATGRDALVPAAQTVTVGGPEIAAADAEINANILVNLSKALTEFRIAGILSGPAVKLAAQHAWEGYMGIPYTPDLDDPDGSGAEDIADLIDQTQPEVKLTARLP